MMGTGTNGLEGEKEWLGGEGEKMKSLDLRFEIEKFVGF